MTKVNTHIIAISEEEEKEGWNESLFEEIMSEHVLNLVKHIDLQIQVVEQIPSKEKLYKIQTDIS